MINKGWNKLLYDKRLEFSLSLKQASKQLSITRTTLHLIENGYFRPTKKLKQKFITTYGLKEDFFDDDLCYPVMISDESYKTSSNFVTKLTHNIFYKIGCGILTAGCLVIAILGVVNNIDTKNHIPSFYNETVLSTREYLFENADEVTPKGNGFKEYTINKETISLDGVENVSFTMTDNDQDLPSTKFDGTLFNREVVPFFDETEQILLRSSFSHSVKIRGIIYDVVFRHNLKQIASCTVAERNGEYIYSFVKIYDNGELVMLENGDPRIEQVSSLFIKHANIYKQKLNSLFESREGLNVGYYQFIDSLVIGNQSVQGKTISNSCLMIFGIIFSTLFFALLFLFIFKRGPIIDKVGEDASEDTSLKQEVVEFNKTPLKRNWKLFPVIPGSFIRIASCIMIFIASIGTYLLFQNIVNINVAQSIDLIDKNKMFSLFLVIAFILLLFTKNDLVQEKKDYFLTNYFYFFSGLALYLLVIALSRLSVVDTTIRGSIENIIVNVLPGNFLWGFLAFNMAVFLLFYRPASYGNDQEKLFKFRLWAILPIAYLIASLVITLVQDFNGNVFPVWLSFLFFNKATYLIIFVLLYTLFCFFYKRYTIKKFGIDNALLYQRGNKYYLVRNIVASLIILAIGIFEIIALNCFPDNPAGFGKNVLILIAIPFVLLYHPHHGKRDSKTEWGITIFYGLANVVGICLIVLSVLGYIIRFF